jgi:hypothetical protein
MKVFTITDTQWTRMFFQQIYLSQETSSKDLLRLNQDSKNTFYLFSHVAEEGVDMSTPDSFFLRVVTVTDTLRNGLQINDD